MRFDFLKRFAVIVMTVLLGACNAVDMEQYVDDLYDRMSQEERIAQLRSAYMDDLFDEEGKLDVKKCEELIPYGIGHFSQYASQKPMDPNVLRDRVAAVQDWLMNNTPNGIPALYHEEVLTGVNTRGATVYPQQIGQAGSFNPELAELKTLQTGIAMRKMGGVLSLSPMVDVCRVPSFNRLEESYGEDAYLSAVGRGQRRQPPSTAVFTKIVAKKVVAVSTKIVHVMRRLWKGNKTKLSNIFKEAKDRSELVATFLAVLELCKSNRVKIDGDGDDMTVTLNKERKSNEYK